MALRIKTSSGTIRDINTSERDEIRASLGIEDAPVVPAPVFTTQPVVSGTAQQGQTLTSTTGVASNASTYARQWLRNGSAISAQTGASYVLTLSDVGAAISVRVAATGPTGLTATATSAATSAVIAAAVAPGAPTSPVATAGDGTASVTATAPSSTGGASLDRWRVIPYIGSTAGTPVENATLPIAVTPLTNGQAYTFKVQVRNAAGLWSVESAASSSVTPTAGAGAAPTFTPQAETVTAMNAVQVALGAPVPDRRQRTIDRMVERLKEVGAWAKLDALYVTGWETKSGTLVNIKNPGTNDLVENGAVVHTALNGYTYTTGGTSFHSTGILPSTLAQNDVSMGVLAQGFVQGTGASYVMGSVDTTSLNGLSIQFNTGLRPFIACMGAEVQSNSISDGAGMFAVNRKNATEFEFWHNSVKMDTLASVSATPSTIVNPIALGKINGRSTNCRNRIRASFIGKAMTDVQLQVLYAALQDCTDKMRQGEMLFYKPATQAELVQDFDHIVYGTTLGAFAHAVQLKRRGESVAMVGGWRERYSVGGMTVNGLGFVDWDNISNLTGLARTWLTSARTKMGLVSPPVAPDLVWRVTPRALLEVLRAQLDSGKGGYDIPIFQSEGVGTVHKSGKRVTGFTTKDGRRFNAAYFHDGTYEFDLGEAAGISYATGREAAGSGREIVNGYNTAGGSLGVSPYNTEGVSASGLLPNVYSIDKAEGAADPGTQSYNFRMTWTTDAKRMVPLVPTAPPGYSADKYEILGRLFTKAVNPFTALGDFLKLDFLGVTDVLDVNNKGFFSTDWTAGDKAGDYVRATTSAERETVWQNHRNYQLGLLYWVLNSGDPRIPAGVVTALQGYGWDPLHYLDPKTTAELHFMQQMYIREMRRARRADGWIYNANDAGMTDGTTPRSPYPGSEVRTIAENSYSTDSHGIRLVADVSDPDPTKHTIKGEGGFFETSGGGNKLSPMPLAIATDSGTLENLSWSFAFVATHGSIGALRMEMPMLSVGQGTADIAWLARTNGNLALESVDYTTYRTAAQAATWDPVPPRLPLVN